MKIQPEKRQIKWAIELSKDNKMSPKNHRKKKLRRTNGKRCKNRELPTNVCYEKFSFRRGPEEKNPKNNENGAGKTNCNVHFRYVSVCEREGVSVWVQLTILSVASESAAMWKAELFGKFPIKDKPWEMDAICSCFESPFSRGIAKWIEGVAKKYQLPASVSLHLHTSVSAIVSAGVSATVSVSMNLNGNFLLKMSPYRRYGTDVSKPLQCKEFPLNRWLTALSIWLGLWINKRTLRKQAKLNKEMEFKKRHGGNGNGIFSKKNMHYKSFWQNWKYFLS